MIFMYSLSWSQIMGSGLKSVPFPKLLEAVHHVYEIAIHAKLQLATRAIPLSEVAEHWNDPGKPRIVFTTS